jgi:hypothetical protein
MKEKEVVALVDP